MVKVIYILLDRKSTEKIPINVLYTTVIDTKQAIEKGEEEVIYTTCTHFLSPDYFNEDIFIVFDNKVISMKKILENGTQEGREITMCHIWEKMLYKNILDINIF